MSVENKTGISKLRKKLTENFVVDPRTPRSNPVTPSNWQIFDTRDVLSPPPKGHMPLSSIENVCTPVKFWVSNPNSPKTPTPFKEAVAETVSRRGPITYTPESPGHTLDDIVELIKTEPVNENLDDCRFFIQREYSQPSYTSPWSQNTVEPQKNWEDVVFGKTKDQVQLTRQAHAFFGRNRTYRRLLMQ